MNSISTTSNETNRKGIQFDALVGSASTVHIISL